MEHQFTEKEKKGIWSFLVETFELTDEQTAAVHHQIPMTQELFEQIISKCNDIGPDMDKLFYRLLDEYSDLMKVYAEKITKEVEAANLPPMPDETKVRIKKNLDEWIEALESRHNN